ncbi:protein transport protein Sec24-like [Canna indica]|uniref:Protein transport protein Sec24-like n=1 Tax=Canna indica TaxID=4628 RepID=A0AAQ3K9A3_9LILI|nr:protein transport protein Sec24-like [Canna indica]
MMCSADDELPAVACFSLKHFTVLAATMDVAVMTSLAPIRCSSVSPSRSLSTSMASSSPPFASGPPQPRPWFSPTPDPNVAGAAQNSQIGRPQTSSGAPPPFAGPTLASSRPGPPPPFSSRPPPSGAVPQGPIASNGPPVPGFTAPRIPPTPSVQKAAPVGTPASIRAPPPSATASQAPGVRPFPGSPPAGASLTAHASPFVGPPASQPFGRPPAVQSPFAGPPTSQPSFTGSPTSQRPFGGPPTSQPPFAGAPTSQRPFAGQPTSQPPFAGQPTSQPFSGPSAQAFTGRPTSQPYTGPLTSQPYAGRPSSPSYMGAPASQPFSQPPTMGTPFGVPAWPLQPGQVAPSMPGNVQAPPRMFGMPPGMPGQSMSPVPPAMGHTPLAGSQVSTPSKIDPNQIPRPMPSSSVTVFETRHGNQANVPPPATSNFVAKDNGNCSPRLMRCTMNQIPCTGDLLSTSSMPLALMVQPLALPHPSEEPIQIVDFGESGPIRCSRCKGYINSFMRFIDHGRRFVCNLCGFTNETPRDYYCNLGPDGRRRDADERPELCRGTVEFIATREYMVRDPMPAVFFFLIDVSMNAVQTGATAAACSAISQSLADLPDGPRTGVGVATFDCSIHFYNLKRASQQPLMLIIPDIHDVYTPLHSDIIVQLTEYRQSLEQLLENIPSMFESNKVAESAFGAAIKAGFLALKPTGGKLLVFQSVLPSVGVGSLSSREAEGRTNVSSGDKEAHKLLQPADKTLKTMAIEFAEYQVCVDIFVTTQTFVDIASISVVPGTTGGQVYYYYPFNALSDPGKLYNDLRWNISRPQGFEAVMRVRCSQGLQVQEYSGNFCKRIPTDIDLPGIDCDKTIMVTFKHDDKFQDNAECAFQCAVLHTTVYGQRRIRVINLSLPCTNMLSSLFRSADLDTQFACFLKQAASSIPMSPLSQVREQIINLCINILYAYRKFCATVSSSGQLILPEALKLLPLYTLALSKSIGLQNDGRLDDRSYWVSRVASLSISLAIPLVYPRMISIHDLTTREDDGSLLSSNIPLSSEHINDDGIYLLENGEDGLIYVGSMASPETLQKIFGVSSVDGLPSQLVLQQFDNDLSKKLNEVINEIRQQRCSYLRLRLCRKGDPSGLLFLSYMVEDKTPGALSYVEFLVHVHRQIQNKMS